MFKNATIFRIADDFTLPTTDGLEEALAAAAFLPCGPTQAQSVGWVPPRGQMHGPLAEYVGRTGVILKLCVERRVVPSSAIKEAADLLVARYKEETGRERVGGRIKKEFKEEANLALLPRAFTKKTVVTTWLDTAGHFIIVDSASLAGADMIVSAAVDALSGLTDEFGSDYPSIAVRTVQTQLSPGKCMADWLVNYEAPEDFTVDRDCELKTPDDQKSAVRYQRHTLDIEEVALHIESGKVPTKLAMTWNERVSFVLKDTMQLAKIKLLDVVFDGQPDADTKDDSFDADIALVTGELSGLIPALLNALGGEQQ